MERGLSDDPKLSPHSGGAPLAVACVSLVGAKWLSIRPPLRPNPPLGAVSAIPHRGVSDRPLSLCAPRMRHCKIDCSRRSAPRRPAVASGRRFAPLFTVRREGGDASPTRTVIVRCRAGHGERHKANAARPVVGDQGAQVVPPTRPLRLAELIAARPDRRGVVPSNAISVTRGPKVDLRSAPCGPGRRQARLDETRNFRLAGLLTTVRPRPPGLLACRRQRTAERELAGSPRDPRPSRRLRTLLHCLRPSPGASLDSARRQSRVSRFEVHRRRA